MAIIALHCPSCVGVPVPIITCYDILMVVRKDEMLKAFPAGVDTNHQNVGMKKPHACKNHTTDSIGVAKSCFGFMYRRKEGV